MLHEAHVLFAGVLACSVYLGFRVLESGLLGSLSAKYFEWAGRTEERRRLELALQAEKATLHFRPPNWDYDGKTKFEVQADKVPVDDLTGEVLTRGPAFMAWVADTRKALIERGCEAILVFRQSEQYYRDTFCKMSQGLASMKAWKEAQDAHQACDKELQEVAEWASQLKPGWERQIFPQCVKMVDEKLMQEQRKEQQRMSEEQERKRERFMATMNASQKAAAAMMDSSKPLSVSDADAAQKAEEARLAEAELLNEEEAASKKKSKKASGKKA